MRVAAVVAGLLLLALARPARGAEGLLLDAVLAEVGPSVITLSDVALARALGVFGLEPSSGPITDADLERVLDAQLALSEATQLAIEAPAADVDRAWAKAGGAALAARLAAQEIDPAWGRRVIEADLRVERFVDERFRAFAFVSEIDVDEALGPGPHDEAARERTRARLRAEVVARAVAAWREDARQRVVVRRVPGLTGPWPAPFTLPR